MERVGSASTTEKSSDVSCVATLWSRMFPYGYKHEFRALFRLAWPAVLTSFFQFLMLSQSVIFSGHLGKEELDAVALANSFINVLGFVIGIGLVTACDTLFSQTFGSANKARIGIYLQRSFLVIYMFLFPLWTVWLNIEPLLVAIGQDRVVASLSANYMTVAMPALLFEYTFLILARYMQNQGIVLPPMVAAILGNLVSALIQYLLLYVYDYGYIGSAIALVFGELAMVLFEIVYILVSKLYKCTWTGLEREAVYDVGMFLKLAVPGVMMVSMETWSFEIATPLSGLLGTTDLGTQSVVFQIDSLAFMVSLGMSIAVNIRVGQQLGEMNAAGAMTTYRVALTMVLFTASSICIVIISLKQLLPSIFTNDPEIANLVSSILPLVAACQFFDGFAAVSSGALRGAGHQAKGALVCLFGFYILALPIGITLAFTTSLRVIGFWLGLLIGIAAEAAIYMTLVFRLDWSHECCKAQNRAGLLMQQAESNVAVGNTSGNTNKLALFESMSLSEKQPLLTSGAQHSDTAHHGPKPATYANNSLGTLRDCRLSLPPRVVVLPERHQVARFAATVALRVVTYAALLALLCVGVLLHVCLPAKPGDHFCSHASSVTGNQTDFAVLTTASNLISSVSR